MRTVHTIIADDIESNEVEINITDLGGGLGQLQIGSRGRKIVLEGDVLAELVHVLNELQ